MILADTSVWIDHFRRGSASFARQLESGEVATHIVVIGELATGNLLRREATLTALRRLPRAKEGTSEECFSYLETHRLFGIGLGWNDLQLLVAAQLNHARLWSLDRPLALAAKKLDLLFSEAT
ncbi:MAG: PIN domain-containing protein [Chthoniobacterales bacterium]|nr:PIN domain-containing protein [Chthoniobacterales bacterium]